MYLCLVLFYFFSECFFFKELKPKLLHYITPEGIKQQCFVRHHDMLAVVELRYWYTKSR